MSSSRKRITQETFDAAVKENVEDFEMSSEEAIQDARKQFEMQGIDLSNINMQAKSTDNDNADDNKQVHPVVELSNQLLSLTTDNDDEIDFVKFLNLLDSLNDEMAKDKSLAIVATEAGVVSAISNGLQHADDEGDSSTIIAILKSLIRILQATDEARGHVSLIAKSKVRAWSLNGDENVRRVAIAAATALVTKNEKNKQFMQAENISIASLKACQNSLEDAHLAYHTLLLIKQLVTRDDIEAPNSKTFDYARDLFMTDEIDTIELLLNIGQTYSNKESNPFDVTDAVLLTIKAVAVNDEICKKIADAGALTSITEWLQAKSDKPGRASAAMAAFRKLAHSDDVKHSLGSGDAIGLRAAVDVLSMHHDRPIVLSQAMAVIGIVCLRKPEHAHTFASLNGLPLIAQSMRKHTQSSQVQRQGCLAIRNIAARNLDTLGQSLIEEGVEPLIRAAQKTHPICQDVAYAALRDLGLE